MNTDEKRKKIAYDLTLEYIRANNVMFIQHGSIPEQVQDFGRVYSEICAELKKLDAI